MFEHGYSVTDIRVCLAGGADRDRTDDLKLAKLALSQLSYGPGKIWWLARSSSRIRRQPSCAKASEGTLR